MMVHYLEPALTITDVLSPEGQAVDTVEIRSLTVAGQPVLPMLRLMVRYETRPGHGREPGPVTTSSDHPGLRLGSGGRLLCEVPCAFGHDAGRAELRVVADGGRATVNVEATYQSSLSGCGSGFTDGTDVVVQLRPSSRTD